MSRVAGGIDAMEAVFDDGSLVADAGLLLAGSVMDRLGLEALIDDTVRLGGSAGAGAGRKVLTLVASALVGGRCIDDVQRLRSGASGAVLPFEVMAPSTDGCSCHPTLIREEPDDLGNGALCVSATEEGDADYRDVCSDKVTVYYASAAGTDSTLGSDGTPLNAGDSYRILYADTDPRRGEKIIVQLFAANGRSQTEGPMFVDYAGAQDRELFTDDYDRDDTPAQQRAAFITALMTANEAADKAAMKDTPTPAAAYCELVWRTPSRGSWSLEVTNCPASMMS